MLIKEGNAIILFQGSKSYLILQNGRPWCVQCNRDVYTGCSRDHRGRHLDYSSGQFVCSDVVCVVHAAQAGCHHREGPGVASGALLNDKGRVERQRLQVAEAAQIANSNDTIDSTNPHETFCSHACWEAACELPESAGNRACKLQASLLLSRTEHAFTVAASSLDSIEGCEAAAGAVAVAAYCGTVWILTRKGHLIVRADDGNFQNCSVVQLGLGKEVLTGAVSVHPMNPSLAAVVMGFRECGEAVREGSLERPPRGVGTAGDDNSAVFVVHLQTAAGLDGVEGGTAVVSGVTLSEACIAQRLQVGWGMTAEDLVVGDSRGALFRAKARSENSRGTKVFLAEKIAQLPLSWGAVAGVAIVAGIAGGEALLIATADKVAIASSPTGSDWSAAVQSVSKSPSGWSHSLLISLSPDSRLPTRGMPPLLRVTSSVPHPTLTHVTWRAGCGTTYTFDLNSFQSTMSAIASAPSLYTPGSLRLLESFPGAHLAADLCTLPWHVLATSQGPECRLLTFSRASGKLIGSTVLPTSLVTPSGDPLLAVDFDDPCGEMHEPIRACVIGGSVLGRPTAPGDTLAVCAALLRARRLEAAHNLLKASRELSPCERSCGWSSLGLTHVLQGDWHGAADAFSRMNFQGSLADVEDGWDNTSQTGIPFAEAALIVAEVARGHEHLLGPCRAVDVEVRASTRSCTGISRPSVTIHASVYKIFW
jgi:hypothetical protein